MHACHRKAHRDAQCLCTDHIVPQMNLTNFGRLAATLRTARALVDTATATRSARPARDAPFTWRPGRPAFARCGCAARSGTAIGIVPVDTVAGCRHRATRQRQCRRVARQQALVAHRHRSGAGIAVGGNSDRAPRLYSQRIGSLCHRGCASARTYFRAAGLRLLITPSRWQQKSPMPAAAIADPGVHAAAAAAAGAAETAPASWRACGSTTGPGR
jgi:hypothetical protein